MRIPPSAPIFVPFIPGFSFVVLRTHKRLPSDHVAEQCVHSADALNSVLPLNRDPEITPRRKTRGFAHDWEGRGRNSTGFLESNAVMR